MVRLDRTIGFPRLALTGVVGLMVRASRTTTMKEADTPLATLFQCPWGQARR
jgi:hypothetical protein